MKKVILSLTAVALSAASLVAQSRVNFNNYVSGNAITIGSPTVDGQGGAGAHVGADYSVQLLWAAGSFSDLGSFLAVANSSAPIAFFGATGGSPGTDGAGLFDGGTVALGGPAGTYTFLVRAWYNVGYDSYVSAYGVAHTGESALFEGVATVSPTPAINTMFGAFSVSLVPEPSAFALAGLGAAAMLIFRRRK